MMLSRTTKELLETINTTSGGTLRRSMDLGILIEIAQQQGMQSTLDDLAFIGKFLTKSFELMKRIGKGGEGYDTLEREFSAQTEKSRAMMNSIVAKADAVTVSHFSATYLAMDTVAMHNVMQLFHDLGWYKNYQIDRR
jgi:hypothetical protein